MIDNQIADDVISLGDIIRFLIESWQTIVAATIFCLFGGLVFIFVTKPQFEAKSAIEIGRVAGNQIFVPEVALERMKLSTVQDEVVKSIGLSDSDEKATFVRQAMVKATLTKAAKYIEIRMIGRSTREAEDQLSGLIKVLIKRHQTFALSSLERTNREFDAAKNELEAAIRERKILGQALKKASSQVSPSDAFSQTVMMASLLNSKDSQIKDLHSKLASIQDGLLPANTFQTRQVEQVKSFSSSVSPNKTRILLIAIFIGLVFGVFAALVKKINWRKLVTT